MRMTMHREYSIEQTGNGFVSIMIREWEPESDICYLVDSLLIPTIGL